MTRRELVLKKIHSLSNEEQKKGMKALVHCIKKKLRIGSKFDRTKSGAYSHDNLGDHALNYYTNKTLEALYNPEKGWDWKFEERSFSEQLVRIAEKFMSDEPKRYLNKVSKESPPLKVDADFSEILYKFDNLDDDSEEKEELSERIIKIAQECADGDTNLSYFVLRYFEGADVATIASEMDLTKDDVNVLRRKLVRKMESRKSEIQVE